MGHSSQNTANEYDAKHEPDIAKKMANVWEQKTMENDGGKLPSTFCKDPRQVAQNAAKAPRKHAIVEAPNTKSKTTGGIGSRTSSRKSTDADAGPGSSGPPPSFGRQKSVVEMTSKFNKKVKSNEEIEAEVRKEINKARDVERAQAGKTIQTIEEQIAALQATIAQLKDQVS